jgi:hypothetical protein
MDYCCMCELFWWVPASYSQGCIFGFNLWSEKYSHSWLRIQSILKLFFCLTYQICQPFFKLLTLITEPSSGPSGLPCFTQLVLQRIWEVAEFCPQSALDWLAVQVPRNKLAHSWVLQSMETWVEHFLLGHNNQRVRSGEHCAHFNQPNWFHGCTIFIKDVAQYFCPNWILGFL